MFIGEKLMAQQKKLKKNTKVKIILAISFLAILIGLAFFLFSGDNKGILRELFDPKISNEQVRKHLAKLGYKGYITVGVLAMLQVLLTFLPAEPVQVVAGLSFGINIGFICCVAGVIVGNTILYLLYKTYGQGITDYFETKSEFDFDVARRSNKIAFVIFILYFLPAIPYGLICLFAASLNIKYPKYIFLTTIGVIPSVLMGVGLGSLAMASSWVISLAVFLVIIALLALVAANRAKIFEKVNNYMLKKEKQATYPKQGKRWFLGLLVFGTKFVFDTKIKVRFKKKVKRLEKPAIVIANHGSALDFVYAARAIRKERPHFVSARLYFYHKKLGKLMKSVGCLPKSMFTGDLENAKACLKVLEDNRVLAMMPEARLSTAGVFEDIQDSTYKFIQRSNVPVYVIKLSGDYLAKPKWGKGIRRGSLIEVELYKLFDGGTTKAMDYNELVEKINKALYYDEFEWLETKPNIRYRSKVLAEGLENILSRCPQCNQTYTLTTKGKTVTCSHCNATYTIDERYRFIDDKPFKNLRDWFNWQNEILRKEAQNPDYQMVAKVELRHGSQDGKTLTRHAGEGVATLDKTGLTYVGTRDGEQIEKKFPLSQIYRLLFGAGEDFEIYMGTEIYYFVPEDRRSAVEWYLTSMIFSDRVNENR